MKLKDRVAEKRKEKQTEFENHLKNGEIDKDFEKEIVSLLNQDVRKNDHPFLRFVGSIWAIGLVISAVGHFNVLDSTKGMVLCLVFGSLFAFGIESIVHYTVNKNLEADTLKKIIASMHYKLNKIREENDHNKEKMERRFDELLEEIDYISLVVKHDYEPDYTTDVFMIARYAFLDGVEKCISEKYVEEKLHVGNGAAYRIILQMFKMKLCSVKKDDGSVELLVSLDELKRIEKETMDAWVEK